jgi:flagellar hook-associated protein 3 FlgL
LQVGAEQARIGTGQSRLKLASGSLDASKVRLTSAIQALESVDSYEAATRINLLMSQLETSYALTGRISRMSLLSYI